MWVSIMAILEVMFSREGYKLERFLAKNQFHSNVIMEFWELMLSKNFNKKETNDFI